MNTAHLIRRPRVRHAAAVSAGALALCLSGAGTAYADTLPTVPGLPSPDGVITTLDQTVTQVTGTDPGLTTPTSPPAPSSPPTTTQQPPATTTGAGTTGTGTTGATKPAVTLHRVTTRRVSAKPATGRSVPTAAVD